MRASCLLVAFAVLACGSEAELQVDVYTDLVSGEEFDAIRVRVAGTEILDRAPVRSLVDRGERVGPFVVAPGSVSVEVALLDGERVVVERAQTVTVRGTHVIPIWLVRACVEVDCPEPGGDPRATECESGRCVVPDCSADDPACAATCTLDSDCAPPTASCLRAECRDGRCLDVARAGACLDSEYCDPTLGCRPRTMVLDDAGVAAEAGMPCESDAACADGNACTRDACVAGRCVVEPMGGSCDDGVFCNGADACSGGACVHAGSPCGGATCTEAMHACGTCTTAADCPPAATGAWGACAYADGCAASGTRTRTTTGFACSAGLCVGASTTETDAVACVRTTEGTVCGTTTYGPVGACTAATPCAESGTTTRMATDFACVAGACAPRSRSETMGCARTTAGLPCDDGTFCNGGDTCSGGACAGHAGSPCGGLPCDEGGRRCSGCGSTADCPAPSYGAWGSCSYERDCEEGGRRERTVTSYACTAGSCVPSTSTESDTGGCGRSTSGMTCEATMVGGWSACGYGDECTRTGSRTRTVTRFECAGGSCAAMPTTETDVPGCDRETNGAGCGGGAILGGWTPCTGADVCSYDGSHRRTRRDLACVDGACQPGPEYDEMESCPRDTDGIICISDACNYLVCGGGSCGTYGGSNCAGGTICCGSYCDYYCF